MTISTIIVDDEARGVNILENLLQQYAPQLTIVAKCYTAEEAIETIAALKPQLIFLDISLGGRTGFDVLEEIGKHRPEIIFVTAHLSYTLQAFKYSAVDYLLKPIEEDLLVAAIDRATSRINAASLTNNIDALLHNLRHPHNQQETKLCVPSLTGFQVIDLKNILSCEASGSYTYLHSAAGSPICSAKPIHDYELLLDSAGFVRIHKSYLVNLLHIKEYIKGEGGQVVMTNGKQLEVSRRKKDAFMARLKNFYKY